MENQKNKVHSFIFATTLNEDISTSINTESTTDCLLKRTDSKINLTINNDGIINNKFKWIDLFYQAPNKIRQPESVIYLINNQYLEQSLTKVFSIYSIDYKYNYYMIPFLLKELSYKDGEIIKCEIFNQDMIEKIFPLSYFDIDYINRIYIRFSFVDKKGKDSINHKYSPKKGNIRLFEYIFDVI